MCGEITYDFFRLSKSFDVPLLISVSGYESLDNAKAAGADITDADIKCFAETLKTFKCIQHE